MESPETVVSERVIWNPWPQAESWALLYAQRGTGMAGVGRGVGSGVGTGVGAGVTGQGPQSTVFPGVVIVRRMVLGSVQVFDETPPDVRQTENLACTPVPQANSGGQTDSEGVMDGESEGGEKLGWSVGQFPQARDKPGSPNKPRMVWCGKQASPLALTGTGTRRSNRQINADPGTTGSHGN